MITVIIAAIAACIACSAFFSASEMSYSSCNKVRLENAMEDGDKAAARAVKITDRYDDALSAILVGNNLVNIAASSLGSVLVILLAAEQYAWASTAIITLLVIVFGETIPKIAASKNATVYAMKYSGIIRVLMIVLKPVTWLVVSLVNLLTSALKGEENDDEEAAVEELHSIIETAEDEEIIDQDSSELVSAAIDFADISVSEVMTARIDITAIDIDDDRDEIWDIIENSPYTRIPVYDESIDHVIGILSLNRYLKAVIDDPDVNMNSMMMEPCFLYKTIKLPDALEQLRKAQQHLAIVTDEYGGTLGVVTMEDILEQLVGDIWDETDVVEEGILEKKENEYEVYGDTPVFEFLELLGWNEDQFDFESETVGGWCIEMLEGFPEAGSSFRYRNIEVTILETAERRVIKALIRRTEEE
ncbi:MAG: HlyC/CorC family transporter [Solobacterium sp.]|nr:HlyC/CorC family transporter [Solobacterium sp.]MBR0477536.1 HlyC/CorC family transporter [Solobacterium sp.]